MQWLRQQPGQQELVRACYFDDPLAEAADRFWQSPEWAAIRGFLPTTKGDALDLGAGRGISSYALAQDGWRVTALEPDPSDLVGAGAIRALAAECGLAINVVSEYSENLPFPDQSFDIVNCRQVLHHARDLQRTCREIFRVLRPGGVLIATRDHVLSKQEDLAAFQAAHPLHHLYGGEHAWLLDEYKSCISGAGLGFRQILAPFDSIINYAPASESDLIEMGRRWLSKTLSIPVPGWIFSDQYLLGRRLTRYLFGWMNRRNYIPGRLYSFIAEKPTV